MIDDTNGSLEVENPAVALRDEDGIFEVTSPYGHVFQVKCRRGVRMSIRGISEPKFDSVPDRMIWRIRRLNSAVLPD